MFRTESEFVRWLQERVRAKSSRLKLGIGDDAAVVGVSRTHDLVLTADLSIEGVHFTRRLHPAGSVGHRALARSLSDVAAMGGVPRFALVSVALPRATQRAWVDQFFARMLHLAAKFGVAVAGGDTAVVSRVAMIDVTVAGEVPRGQGIRRSGAKPGDHLFVSGTLGQSARGLQILKSRLRGGGRVPANHRRRTVEEAAIRSHLYPDPRCKLGSFLQRNRLASALMDVSDGFAVDLGRLCAASGVGAEVWGGRILLPKGCEPRIALELALHGGEDYELIFSVPRRNLARVPRSFQGVPLHDVGEIRRSPDLTLVLQDGRRTPLIPAGYDHFSKK